jgi:hypothetical protein
MDWINLAQDTGRWRALGPSCTSSRPSSIRLRHSETLDFFIAYSPQANANMANASLSLLPNCTHNLMCIRCSRFLSLSFPPTLTACSAAWERAAHWVCSSCKRELEHVQTCWSTRVCQSQHRSDTLLPFRELHCCTTYL